MIHAWLLSYFRPASRSFSTPVYRRGAAPGVRSALHKGMIRVARTISGCTGKPTVFSMVKKENDYYLQNWQAQGLGSVFEIYEQYQAGESTLIVPGKHNALNALAAIATNWELGLVFAHMSKAIAVFLAEPNGISKLLVSIS